MGRGKQSPPEIINFLLRASVVKEPVTVLKDNVQLTRNKIVAIYLLNATENIQ